MNSELGRLGMLLIALVFLGGCPRQPQDPDPGEGTPCSSLADCNTGVSCGETPLSACVDGLCEETPTLVRPCPPRAFAPDGG